MPLFGHRNEVQNQSPPPPPQPTVAPAGRSSGSIFRRSRDEVPAPSPVPTAPPPQTSHNGGGFGSIFGNRRSSVERDNASISTNGSNGNVLRGRNTPPSDDLAINAARQKVHDAEYAERNADEALLQARAAVREAREHVGLLEREAEEESARARAKQAVVKNVSKSARGLGRHG